MKYLLNFFMIATFLMLTEENVEARRHHKFKGVIIVNQILKLEGVVTDNGVEIPEYSGVKQGDILETAEKSLAVIRIPGLGIFRMGPKTKFRLTKFNDRDQSRFEILNGEILALFRRHGDHEFIANHSIIKLHGTTFFITSRPDETSDQVCLCDGKIDVKALKETKESEKPTRKPQAPGPVSESSAAPTVSISGPTGPSFIAAPESTKMPLPTATSTPLAPTPIPLPSEVEMKSEWSHKQCEISDGGIELKTNKLLELHSDREIKELESLYALP